MVKGVILGCSIVIIIGMGTGIFNLIKELYYMIGLPLFILISFVPIYAAFMEGYSIYLDYKNKRECSLKAL